jgi:hypothetical protein
MASSETEPLGINDRRQIVGVYSDSQGSHGFLSQATKSLGD